MSSFRARTPEDLLALAPILLGFTPTESLVVLTFEPKGAAHLRLDLDEVGTTLPDIVDTPILGTKVVLIAYTTDLDAAAAATTAAADLIGAARIMTTLQADGTTWRPWMGSRYPEDGAAYDTAAHPFTLQAQFDGRTIHPSMDALAATLTPDTSATDAELDAAHRHLEELLATGDPLWVTGHIRWAQDRINTWANTATHPAPADLALLAVTMQFAEIRDAVFGVVTAGSPAHYLDTVLRVAAYTPPQLAAPARCLAAWTALECGNGALARLQLELAADSDPDYPLLEPLTSQLATGRPPQNHPFADAPAPAAEPHADA